MSDPKKVFSFDAETNGLWGHAFAIGALVIDGANREIARFIGRLPDSAVTNGWVRENVLPALATVPVEYETEEALLAAFAEFYLANKADADIIVHVGTPVEAGLIRDLHDGGHIGDWDAPFPLLDVSAMLRMAGYNPNSVDDYNVAFGNSPDPAAFNGGAHNPLYDSAAAAAAYWSLMGW